MRRECNDDRCLYRKFNKYAFCVNGLVSVWGTQHLLHIDVLFFRNMLNVQHRIEWVQLDRLKKALKCNDTSSSHLMCKAAWRTPKIIRMWILILISTNSLILRLVVNRPNSHPALIVLIRMHHIRSSSRSSNISVDPKCLHTQLSNYFALDMNDFQSVICRSSPMLAAHLGFGTEL